MAPPRQNHKNRPFLPVWKRRQNQQAVPGGLHLRWPFAARVDEVAPKDDTDDWDGNVGARLLYKLIGFALLSQNR